MIFADLIWYKSTVPSQNEIYRDLLDNLADGVYFTDLQGRIIFWSKGAERLSGYSRSEVLGKRCSDSIRWGGDEFVAVIHDTDSATLRGIGERLRILVEKSMLPDLESLCVTVSIGDTMASSGDTPESLVRRTDKYLLRAKGIGRNRVLVDEPVPGG